MLIIILLIALVIMLAIKATDAVHARSRRAEQARAAELLDAAFNGKPAVTYPVSARTLHSSEVIEGGIERGYRLVSNTGGRSARTLVFERV